VSESSSITLLSLPENDTSVPAIKDSELKEISAIGAVLGVGACVTGRESALPSLPPPQADRRTLIITKYSLVNIEKRQFR
jgi:hypothetical protein